MGKAGEKRYSKEDIWTTPDSLFLVSCWVRDGYTDLEISKKIGVSPNTLSKWKQENEKFAAVMLKDREIVDYEVENALFKRAVGFKTKEVKTIVNNQPDENGNIYSRIETTEKEIIPDATACLAWLNNRKPDKWKRNRDNFDDGTKNNNVTIKIEKADNSLNITAETNDEDWED